MNVFSSPAIHSILVSIGRKTRWITPLLITIYVVVVLLVSGLSKAHDEQAATSPVDVSETHR